VPIDPRAFHESFFEEVAEHLERLEELVFAIESPSATREDFDALFRVAHSIKGASGIFGFREMAEITHDLESVLDLVREGQLAVTRPIIDTVLRTGDVLRDQLAAYRMGDTPHPEGSATTRAVLQSLLEERTEVAAAVPASTAGESDLFGFFDDEPAIPGPVVVERRINEDRRTSDDSTVRVKLQKIDDLINLVGELLIAQASLQDRATRLDPSEHADLHASINELQRHTRDVRESVMSIRMIPIGSIFNRFPRMVRDLAEKLGKDVAFESSGGETELDKGLIESIVDPLTHIVRNCIDHGIEKPEERIASGKPAQGTIAVRSFQRGGNVVVEIRDDGRGMNRERILAKAIENGIPVKENMSDREIWALVCMPGFSTAAKVTDVSGRGVGMDVVKRNLHALGGAVEIDSVEREGTAISLILPLTLAILDGLAVRTGEEICIVPLTSITESVAIAAEDVVRPPDAVPFFMFRGEPVPLVAPPGGTTDVHDEHRIAVVIESDGRNAGLLVDALESEHQVVIKSLERNFRRVPGYSGATIMGNGKVALILDVAAMVGA
jgi:two-component system, chemotaxis family, sensor kinase CheA